METKTAWRLHPEPSAENHAAKPQAVRSDRFLIQRLKQTVVYFNMKFILVNIL